ncbi:hypothetical protein K491DRAFT_588242 [Lophiostoma macrostomum CBS 122681]|uniref:HD/PDEase domain-containing protein n=1 Tax=Lophiostoma macrostomum CBS 122681 TaxID=1314788 RepID=A0A6A6TPK4_9PLEO|nr:hypothetical protein K491DRAFT_588242 [Lophiostoma macrostomum CBS 122681]
MATTIRTPRLPVSPEFETLFSKVNEYVRDFMDSGDHDNSHDYDHIVRVLSNANMILQQERQHPGPGPVRAYDNDTVFFAALLHDMEDYKYTHPGKQHECVYDILLSHGAPIEFAEKLQVICRDVGFSVERSQPARVYATLRRRPELAIVQDADRLDAIGAIGVARCFAFGGARRPPRPLSDGINHFAEKLLKLEGLMKTCAGKRMAKKRTEFLMHFANQFEKEAMLSFGFDEGHPDLD